MNKKVVPAYLIRAYVWELLKVNNGLKTEDYGGLTPIVPIAEEPEITEYDKPYIIYGWAESPLGDGYANRGNMSMVVKSTNFNQLTEIINTITHALERDDESARDVNRFTSAKDQFGQLKRPGFIGLRFGTIGLSYVEGASPETTEGGRQSAALNIRYEYYVDYDIVTSVV